MMKATNRTTETMNNSRIDARLADLAARLDGEVVNAGHPMYDEVRNGWNGRFDVRPAAVVLCDTDEDVAEAVRFARAEGLPLAIRSGGHDYGGRWAVDGTLLIDLRRMNSVSVDADAERAVVGAGARWGDFDARAQAHGLVVPGPTVSHVGVAGVTLGGGLGYLSRKFGLTLDSLASARVVTAEGEVVTASETENPDLFWALRGGGGSFGVVTSFEFRLHTYHGSVLSFQAWHPVEAAEDALHFWRDFMAKASDEVACFAMLLRVPPVEGFPEERHGTPAVLLMGCHAGPPEAPEAIATAEAITAWGDPFLAFPQPSSYLALQQAFDAGMGVKGNRWYSKALDFDALTDEAIAAFVAAAGDVPGPFTTAYFGPGGGAVARVDSGDTAYAHRTAAAGLHIFPGWIDPAEDAQHMEWARRVHEAMAPYANGHAYLNLLDGDEEDVQKTAFGVNLERLRAVKAAWDPENIFHDRLGVTPAG